MFNGATDSDDFYWNQPKSLLNYLILTNVFSFCSLNEMKTCRLVCKDWYTASLKKWRSEMPLHIHFSGTTTSSEPLNLKKLTHALKYDLINLSKYPYKRLVFNHNWIPSVTCLNKRWSSILSNLTHLKFHNIEINKPHNFQRLLLRLPPNLQVLVLNNVSCYCETYSKSNIKLPLTKPQVNLRVCEIIGDRTYRYFPVSRFCIDWLPFLLQYPNLNSISIKNITPSSRIANKQVESLVGAVESLQNVYKRKCNITELDLIDIQEDKIGQPTKLPATLIERLSHLNLSLNTLTIDLGNYCPPDYLLSLFKFYNSLTHFECTRASQVSFTTFQFDAMSSLLTTLYLDGNIFPTVEFLKYTPNLRKLRIQSRILDNFDIIDATDQTSIDLIELQHLEELTLACKPCGESAVRRIMKWSSKLTKLEISLKPEAFPLVCLGMSNLNKLKVLNGNLSDETITGFSNGKRAKPNITDLKNLKRFIMYESTKQDIGLGDLSVIEGFLKSPRLKFISAKFGKLSNDAITALYHSKVIVRLL